MTHGRVRLSIVVSHPIQYQAPLFQRLAQSAVLEPRVLFLSDHGVLAAFDPGFGRSIRFDISLTEGYEYQFLRNYSPRAGVSSPAGLINPGLVRALSRRSSDVVLVHGWAHASEWIASLACAVRRVPYLLRGEARSDTEPQLARSRRTLKHALLRPLIRGAAGCLPIGSRNREFYLSYGAQPERLFFSPYSVDSDRFEEAGDRGRRHREERLRALELDPGLPVILFAGKLQPWKRPLDVARAISLLNVPANALFIGDGPMRTQVEAAASALPRARSLGFINQQEIAEWYGLADIFVLPSEVEPWGLAVNEAMAAGAVPVVSDAAGCAPDLVTPNTGRVFASGDVHELATALSELVASRSCLAALSAAARSKAREFGIEATARGIEEAALFAVARAS